MDSESEGELMKRYEGLRNKEAWNDVCEYCRRPVLLHNRSCTRKNEVENYRRVLDERDKFIERMKIVIRRVENKRVGRMNIDSVTDIELARLYEELVNKDTWNDLCKNCRLPALLHNGVCTRQTEVEASE